MAGFTFPTYGSVWWTHRNGRLKAFRWDWKMETLFKNHLYGESIHLHALQIFIRLIQFKFVFREQGIFLNIDFSKTLSQWV